MTVAGALRFADISMTRYLRLPLTQYLQSLRRCYGIDFGGPISFRPHTMREIRGVTLRYHVEREITRGLVTASA